MTRFLITVGTGSFDGLVNIFDRSSIDCVIQYGSGKKPHFKPAVRFIDRNFNDFVKDFDFIVTHCGAGTVYDLLERNVRFVAIPNLERKDHHQSELFNYLRSNLYCLCLSLEALSESVDTLPSLLLDFELQGGFQSYRKPEFYLDRIIKF